MPFLSPVVTFLIVVTPVDPFHTTAAPVGFVFPPDAHAFPDAACNTRVDDRITTITTTTTTTTASMAGEDVLLARLTFFRA